MGFWSELDKFHDKIDPLDAKVQELVLGKGDPTFGDHKTYSYSGAAYTPYNFAPLANPITQIQTRYMNQPSGNPLAPMAGYQAGGANPAQMGMYQQYKANPQAFMEKQDQIAARPASDYRAAAMDQYATALGKMDGVAAKTSLGGSSPFGGK